MLLHRNRDSNVRHRDNRSHTGRPADARSERENKLIPSKNEATAEQMLGFSLTGRGDHRDLFRRQLQGGPGGTRGSGHLSRVDCRRLHRKASRSHLAPRERASASHVRGKVTFRRAPCTSVGRGRAEALHMRSAARVGLPTASTPECL